jgi:molybdopterin-guanine dinucleotide biosynthesis protein B
MIPIISFVGRSNSGKTTYLIKFIKNLKKRGYEVAVIKHHHDNFEIDHPGKDTWLHAEAGAKVVMISSPCKMAMIQKVEQEYTLEELAAQIKNVDLIITEGYKHGNTKKIEVARSDISKALVCDEKDLFAIVTDLKIKSFVPSFDFNNVDDLADFVIENVLISSTD